MGIAARGEHHALGDTIARVALALIIAADHGGYLAVSSLELHGWRIELYLRVAGGHGCIDIGLQNGRMGLVSSADAAASGKEALVVDAEAIDAARERIGADEQLTRIFGKLVFHAEPQESVVCGGVPLESLSAVLQPLRGYAIVCAMRHLRHELVGHLGGADVLDSDGARLLGAEGGEHVRASTGLAALLDADYLESSFSGRTQGSYPRHAQANHAHVAINRLDNLVLGDVGFHQGASVSEGGLVVASCLGWLLRGAAGEACAGC